MVKTFKFYSRNSSITSSSESFFFSLGFSRLYTWSSLPAAASMESSYKSHLNKLNIQPEVNQVIFCPVILSMYPRALKLLLGFYFSYFIFLSTPIFCMCNFYPLFVFFFISWTCSLLNINNMHGCRNEHHHGFYAQHSFYQLFSLYDPVFSSLE